MTHKQAKFDASVSSECFRLLRLTQEVQSDVKVLKAVVDEVDVLRLCRVLGMTLSNEDDQVAKCNFEFGQFQPVDYDADFARFIRDKLKADDEHQLKVGCLFGKQLDVKKELIRMGYWSKCEGLFCHHQGVYCIEGGGNPTQLIVFAWLDASLFEPEAIRSTPAYVLRFLISLNSNVTCCLSEEDFRLLKREMDTEPDNSNMKWKSCSFAFRVQKQVEQTDNISCGSISKTRLPRVDDTKAAWLVSGAFPAVAMEKAMPSTSEWIPQNTTIPCGSFGEWLKQKRSEGLAIDIRTTVQEDSRNHLLNQFDRFPEKELDALQTQFRNTEEEAKERFYNESFDLSKRVYDETVLDACFLFAVRTPASSAQMDSAQKRYESLLIEWEQNDLLQFMESGMCSLLFLPERVQFHMKKLQAAFLHHQLAFEDVLNAIVNDEPINSYENRGFWRDLIHSARQYFSNDQFNNDFCHAMDDQQARLTDFWMNAVRNIVTLTQDFTFNQRLGKFVDENQYRYDVEENELLRKAFEKFREHLNSGEGHLSIKIVKLMRNSDGGSLNIMWNEEVEKEPRKVIKMYQLGTSGRPMEALGTLKFEAGQKLLKLVTVKLDHAVAILVEGDGTIVVRIRFPPQRKQKCDQVVVRKFPRRCSLCSVRAKDRTIAFLFEVSRGRLGDVAFCKFNESFTSVESTRTINMDTSFSLTTPIVDILLTERTLCAIDGNGNFQSFDTRTRRTSKKVPSGDGNWVGNLMSFADELVVGRVRLDEDRQLWLNSLSNEDHRALPSMKIGLETPVTGLAVGSVDDVLYVVNSSDGTVYSTTLTVTVQSDAYRIQRSGKGKLQSGRNAKDTADSHWLRVFYHSFEKFPVRSLLDMSMDPSTVVSLALNVAVASTTWSTEEVLAVCSKYFRNVMADLRRLNKPLAGLDLTQNLRCLEQSDGPSLQTIPVRCILLAIVAFVPVQICRAEDNMLQLLRDGESTSSGSKETGSEDSEGSTSADASEIARSIRFGLLSPLMESWSGRCVVVTSMGKQSTGKSYFLNHLAGTSFAISGARCTDGAWMSLRFASADTLLVVLDFEGLGSFERSEQEDIFLSVLNAAVSLFTVFRIDSRFDKDIDGLFSRFQKGARLIKDDPRLFRGLLYMNIKDVNMDDRQDVATELVEKLESIFVANKEQNFLTDMYAGQLEIDCSPPFGTIDYYQCMENNAAVALQSIIQPSNKDSVGFVTGKAFLDCLRIVLAKISILDWTSMGKSTKNLIVADIKQKLPGVLRTGCHVSLPLVKELVIPPHLMEDVLQLGSHKKLVVSFQQMCEENPTYKIKWIILNDLIMLDDVKDEDLDVGFDVTSLSDKKLDLVQKTIGDFFKFFLKLIGKTYGESRLTTKDQSDFDTFMAFVLRRRKRKISRWLQDTLGDHLTEERTQLEQRYTEPLVIYLSRCQQRCSKCQLGCMFSVTHSSDIEHSCCTDHQCRGKCEYGECQELTPPCARSAGHEEKCECDKGDHTCSQPCASIQASNCDKTCVKRPEHDGEHCCSVQVHVCGAKCSATSCTATCLLDMQREHTVHKCAEVQCIHSCLMNGCKNLCGVKNHFHGQCVESRLFAEESGGMCTEDNASVSHMCAGSHSCGGMCTVDGICEQKVHLKKSTRTYTGARGSFEYVHHEMNGCKKHCARILPRGEVNHEGFDHSCLSQEEQNTVHYCDARCPSCSYYCNKQFGHLGLHTTSHGNMEQTYFVAKANDFVIESRQYQAGERGIAEMCNLFCSKMGRGHAHYLQCECEDPSKCVYAADGNADQRRHCVDKLLPPPDKAMDEVLHDKFWESIGWEDPCSEEERILFSKCRFQCDAPEHEEGENQPSYCVLDAWHLPEVKPETDDGFAYVDGHKFECVHTVESGKFHNIFVLDSSGSMSGRPWDDLLHACNEFSWNRWKDGGSEDIVSYVSFSHESWIHYEGAPLSECLNVEIPYSGGGTLFEEGLRAANEVLSRNDFQEFKAVLIFFSDGRPADVTLGITLARHIRAAYAKYDLKAFVVGFGYVNLSVLERMAVEMGGEYRQALDADALRAEFNRIAAVLCSSEASLALRLAP